MGTVKRDLHKRDRAADAAYTFTDADSTSSYTPDGIERLLRDVYAICERETYAGDLSATVIRLDLEAALNSNALTPRQRQVIALRYFGQMENDRQVANILGISRRAVAARRQSAYDAIAQHMDDREYEARSQFIADELRTDTPMYAWLESVAMNDGRWWNVPDEVFPELNEISAARDVPLRKEAQKPDFPILNDNQMRHRNRNKEIMRPEVFPNWQFSGYVRNPADGTKVRLPRVN